MKDYCRSASQNGCVFFSSIYSTLLNITLQDKKQNLHTYFRKQNNNISSNLNLAVPSYSSVTVMYMYSQIKQSSHLKVTHVCMYINMYVCLKTINYSDTLNGKYVD